MKYYFTLLGIKENKGLWWWTFSNFIPLEIPWNRRLFMVKKFALLNINSGDWLQIYGGADDGEC